MIQYLIYSVIYFCLCNWIQIYYLLGNLLKPSRQLFEVNGKGLLSKMKEKTGLTLSIKVMPEKKKMIGFMVSSPPFKPVMIFSERLYESLNKDEFEWVVLHESGHYLMWHNIKLVLIQLGLYLSGIYILSLNLFFLVLAVILGFFYIQIARILEFQADYYAVTRMDDPKGMITGNIKMKKVNERLMGGKSFLQRLIIAVSPEDRIKMAEEQIALRKKVKNKKKKF